MALVDRPIGSSPGQVGVNLIAERELGKGRGGACVERPVGSPSKRLWTGPIDGSPGQVAWAELGFREVVSKLGGVSVCVKVVRSSPSRLLAAFQRQDLNVLGARAHLMYAGLCPSAAAAGRFPCIAAWLWGAL